MRYRFIGLLPVLAFAGAGPTFADSDRYRYGGSNDSNDRTGDDDRDDGGNRYDNQGYANQGYGRLPDGSYRDSCRNERIRNGYLLVARCADWNGQLRKTALDLRSCGRGDIRNRGGTLVCRGRVTAPGEAITADPT